MRRDKQADGIARAVLYLINVYNGAPMHRFAMVCKREYHKWAERRKQALPPPWCSPTVGPAEVCQMRRDHWRAAA